MKIPGIIEKGEHYQDHWVKFIVFYRRNHRVIEPESPRFFSLMICIYILGTRLLLNSCDFSIMIDVCTPVCYIQYVPWLYSMYHGKIIYSNGNFVQFGHGNYPPEQIWDHFGHLVVGQRAVQVLACHIARQLRERRHFALFYANHFANNVARVDPLILFGQAVQDVIIDAVSN